MDFMTPIIGLILAVVLYTQIIYVRHLKIVIRDLHEKQFRQHNSAYEARVKRGEKIAELRYDLEIIIGELNNL